MICFDLINEFNDFFQKARVNQEQEHFLINPFGLMYHEVTGSSLVKVDIAGNNAH